MKKYRKIILNKYHVIDLNQIFLFKNSFKKKKKKDATFYEYFF